MGKFFSSWQRVVGCMTLVMVLMLGGMAASFLFLCWSLGYTFSSPSVLEETERRGNQVVEGLERFRTDHGTYPDSLQELSPKYMQEVLPPTWGLKTWIYAAERERKGYDLRVHESVHTGNGASHFFAY